MLRTPAGATLGQMNEGAPIGTIALHEFRLHAADRSGAAARIVAGFPSHTGPGVPLLTSIEDERDVAIVQGLRGSDESVLDRGTLDPLVERWRPVSRYEPRIAERSTIVPSSYRLAVTESGINDVEPEATTGAAPEEPFESASSPLGLLWIGNPVGTHAGLLTLIGNHGEHNPERPEPLDWPLPLARRLGVRIYESR